MSSPVPNLADSKIRAQTKTVDVRHSKRFPISLWITVSVFALVPVARWFLYESDHQLANIAGIGISFLGCIVAYVSVWIHFARTARRKVFFLAMPIAIAAIGLSLFEMLGLQARRYPSFVQSLGLENRPLMSMPNRTNPSAMQLGREIRFPCISNRLSFWARTATESFEMTSFQSIGTCSYQRYFGKFQSVQAGRVLLSVVVSLLRSNKVMTKRV